MSTQTTRSDSEMFAYIEQIFAREDHNFWKTIATQHLRFLIETSRDGLKWRESQAAIGPSPAAHDMTWFWEIVDQFGIANLPSDERGALAMLVRSAATHEHMPRRWRHKTRGTTYTEVGPGIIQTSKPIPDYADVTIYRGEHDGTLWVRPTSEFADGRFDEIVPGELTSEAKPDAD